MSSLHRTTSANVWTLQPAPSRGLRCLILTAVVVPVVASAQTKVLPLKHAPQPTHAAITAADLETRLYIYADDSMGGRRAGSTGDLKATAYIASEFKRLGLVPAGDSGTYFQNIPLVTYAFDTATPLTVGDHPFTFGADFVALTRGGSPPPSIDGESVIYGGQLCDTTGTRLTDAQVANHVVFFAVPTDPSVAMPCLRSGGRAQSTHAMVTVIPALQWLPPGLIDFFRRPQTVLKHVEDTATGRAILLTSPTAARAFFPRSIDSATVGDLGANVQHGFVLTETPAPARNVVAILRGSDPSLSGEYVAVGAHNDHIGTTSHAVDHDSLRAYNRALHLLGAVDPFATVDSTKRAGIHINVDSLHRIHPARRDSISNGADDDGSGTVSLLEIAENLAAEKVHPKRSILFVSHTGEELGLFGSEYFTDHPTVPRDSIVTQLNMDMIGRGDSADIVGGGPNYLQLVGSRRLSTELGDLVEAVNKTEAKPFTFDYQFDANGHPENIYCRSDHYEYARYGIPIVFFTTGQHLDYHQVTDEPEYIDYDHLARVTTFVRDVTVRVANLDHRPLVDKPKPDPHGVCRQ